MIDINKQYQTRDGRKVEIISTSGRKIYSVIGYIGTSINLSVWMPNGKAFFTCVEDHNLDLIEIEE